MDNAEVTTQLAQISTVSGINQLNDTVSALAASLGMAQSLQAASLVGRDVVVAGDALTLADGKAQGGVSLGGGADSVVVTITDSAGKAVRTLDLGKQSAGLALFDWDGKTDDGGSAAEGHYSFSVTATANGQAVSADTLAVDKVDGVSTASGSATLALAGGGSVALGDVRQIR
jgi:flagellar basal-body rod modification protein FlgD